MAYGLKQKLEGPADISSEGRLIPTVQQSIAEYDLLRSANLTSYYHRYSRSWQTNTRPALWPVDGRLQGAFGRRTDPFSGEGAIHTGVDITAPIGTPVRAAADGVVVHAQLVSGGYGRLVVIDLSRFSVIPGQEIRQGEVLGAVGATGRVTAPHLHYEVRRHGNPENPVRYMGSTRIAQATKRDFPF
jgi:murein DD-endopeptidase MepM/ murein hydrolase activator NlpD